MAINIQEILHPSDSSQIKWEKVNYNFDQILANGGGPIGKKGSKGAQGSVGQTGAKGQKGAQGLKGETGTTTSRWETIPVNPSNAANPDYVILKPKLENDTYQPVIFLGDQTYDNVNDNDGLVGLRSTLVIGKHAQGGDSPSDEYLTFWHGPIDGTVNNVSITLDSSEEVDDGGTTFVKYTLAETFGSNLNNPAEIVEFSLGTDRFSIGNGVGTRVHFLGSESTFKLPESAIASPEVGMVRYYQGQYWGAVDNAGTVSWTPFCMSPCGGGGFSGTITLNPADDIEVNYDGSLYGNSIEITNGGDLDVDVNGDPWTGAAATTTQAATSATTQAVVQSIEITATDWSPSTPIGQNGGSTYFTYEVDGGGQILSSANVDFGTAASWVTVSTYTGGPNNDRVEFTVAANSSNQRQGTITITHPNNSNVVDSVGIIQASGATSATSATNATAAPTSATNATAAPTSATNATAAPTLPEYTPSMAQLSVSDGLEGSSTQYTWSGNGSVVTFNPSTMGEGSTTYSIVVQVPSGYSNAGQQVIASDTAVGAPAYKISYDPNGGTGSGTGAGTGGAGLTVAANSFTRSGYTFDTWNTSYMGTGTSYNPGSVPPTSAFTGTDGIYDHLQLYARWAQVPTQATTAPGGSGSGSGSGCTTYTVRNNGSYSVAGSLNGVPNCAGSGNVSVFIAPGQTASFCTDEPAPIVSQAFFSLSGGNNVQIINTTSGC